MELYAHVSGSVRLHKADRLIPIKGNLGVWPVVTDNDVMLPGKIDHSLKEFRFGHGAGRVIGIVKP